jgi:PEP-CTERM motif
MALLGVSQPAQAFTLTFDEFGNCTSSVGTCTSTVEHDPSQNPLTAGNVLVFTLPSLTFSGNVNVLDVSGAISDRLRWIDPNGSSTACPTSACANRLIFYSLDSTGAPADVGPLTLGTTVNTVTENANGTFSFVVPTPGVNVYDGVSSSVPEPSTWVMMLMGFAGLGFAFRQSRRKVSFA